MKKRLHANKQILAAMLVLCTLLLCACSQQTEGSINTATIKYKNVNAVTQPNWLADPKVQLQYISYDAVMQCARYTVTLSGYPDEITQTSSVYVSLNSEGYERLGSGQNHDALAIQNGQLTTEVQVYEVADEQTATDAPWVEVSVRGTGEGKEISSNFTINDTTMTWYTETTNTGDEKQWYYRDRVLSAYEESTQVNAWQTDRWSYEFSLGSAYEAVPSGNLASLSRRTSIKDGSSVYIRYDNKGAVERGRATIYDENRNSTDYELNIDANTWVDPETGKDETDTIKSFLSGEYAAEHAAAEEREEALSQIKEKYRPYGYSDGMLILECDEQYVYADLSLNVYETVWDKAGPFRDGLAYVEKDGRAGYIDKTMNMVIQLDEGAWGTDFSEGYAVTSKRSERGDYPNYVIDTSGKTVFSPTYNGNIAHVSACSEGLFPCYTMIDDQLKMGYMDTAGNIVVEPQYEAPPDQWIETFRNDFSFSQGLATVIVWDIDRKDATYGYINTKGEPVGGFRWYNALPFSDDMGLVYSNEYKYGYVDKNGQVAIEPKWPSAMPFSDGLACVLDPETELVGYIDKTGAYAIEPRWKTADSFENGLAVVEQEDGLVGYIDTKGNYVVEPNYRNATRFIDGYAFMLEGTKNWYVIDANGKIVV